MPRYYTEIRISHRTLEDKKEFEKNLDEMAKSKLITDRTELIRRYVNNYTSKRVVDSTHNNNTVSKKIPGMLSENEIENIANELRNTKLTPRYQQEAKTEKQKDFQSFFKKGGK
jgi:metal-responsive CopG/Arc/MetJ family transcriptional regulator